MVCITRGLVSIIFYHVYRKGRVAGDKLFAEDYEGFLIKVNSLRYGIIKMEGCHIDNI